jgi:hypothetical protein
LPPLSTAGLTGAITHRADNHYHPVLEEAVDYRDPMQEDILRFYLDNPTHKDSLSLQLY